MQRFEGEAKIVIHHPTYNSTSIMYFISKTSRSIVALLAVSSFYAVAVKGECMCNVTAMSKECFECTDDGYPYPTLRFTEWDLLDNNTVKLAKNKLDYVKASWNEVGVAAVEELSWESMSGKKNAAKQLGFDEENWDCWMNHYGDYDWDELKEDGIHRYWKVLGWSRGSWNGNGDAPDSDDMEWDDLSDDEKVAAWELCFFRYSWDEEELVDWDLDALMGGNRADGGDTTPVDIPDGATEAEIAEVAAAIQAIQGDRSELCNCDPDNLTRECLVCDLDGYPFPFLRYTEWDEVGSSTKSIARNVFGFSRYEWNNPGNEDIEADSWESMTTTEQDAAEDLDFDEENWDCWMNHYSDYDWDELVDEEIADYFRVLGWSRTRWESDNAPSSDDKGWDELTDDEKYAAWELCYFEYTWDEEDLRDWTMIDAIMQTPEPTAAPTVDNASNSTTPV